LKIKINRITVAILREENYVLSISTLLQNEFEIDEICLNVPSYCVKKRCPENYSKPPDSRRDGSIASFRGNPQEVD
jgi:hypothetical protein